MFELWDTSKNVTYIDYVIFDYLQNIVLSGGSTMFKDFHKRLQNDIKKIVDERVAATNARHHVEVKVSTTMIGFEFIRQYLNYSICVLSQPVVSGVFVDN